MTVERWRAKADAFAAGWHAKFNVVPSKHAVILGLSVAQHETRCGDSWEGEHNWGAVQKRILTPAEKAVIVKAGLAPHPSKVDDARDVLAVAVEVGDIPAPDHCALHVDSSPGKGWYWVFFWAFPSDDEGAAFFIHVLAEQRASCRAVLDNLGGTEHQLAAAMYGKPGSRYFEGFYKPGVHYTRSADGKWVEGPAGTTSGEDLNIGAYASALTKIAPDIRSSLVDWTWAPAVDPDPVALRNAARLYKLSTEVMYGRGEGLDALDVITDDGQS